MANLFLDTIPPHEGNRDGKGRMKLAYGKPKSQKGYSKSSMDNWTETVQ